MRLQPSILPPEGPRHRSIEVKRRRRACCILLLQGALAQASAMAAVSPGAAPPTTGAAGAFKESSGSDIGGILAGVAGILTGFSALIAAKSNKKQLDDFKRDFVNQLVDEKNIKILTNQGGFLSSKDAHGFGDCLRGQLMLGENLIVIRRFGKFAKQADVREHSNRLGQAESSLQDLRACCDRIRKAEVGLRMAEENLLDLKEVITRMRSAVDEPNLRRKLLEELKQRYPTLRPDDEDQE